MPELLRAGVIGCRMGAGHARSIATCPGYALAAVCDLDRELAEKVAQRYEGTAAYTDAATMLAEVRPDVVAVATPTVSHAALVLQVAAVEGVRGIYAEKPIAVNLGDARAMAAACADRGIALAFNHQRRLGPEYRTMRRLIAEGAIGELRGLRGSCAGDILSDGTHTVNLLCHLAGDPAVQWVVGALHRDPPPADEARSGGFPVSGGYRYGHPVETGAMGLVQFAGGVRAELFCGCLRLPDRGYQDLEASGTTGRLWRAGDDADPALRIWDEQAGGWRAVELDPPPPGGSDQAMVEGYRLLALAIHEGVEHPLGAANALREFEVVMGLYESSRLGRRLALPLEQERFPLAVHLGEG